MTPHSGNKKTFLYTSPEKNGGNNQRPTTPSTGATTLNSPRGTPLDLGNMWSLKNMPLHSSSSMLQPAGTEVLSKTSPTALYSRYGSFNGRAGSPGSQIIGTRQTAPQWSSSGHSFSQSSQYRLSPRTPSDARRREQAPSPLDRDPNDF
ncbi:uncharacterized protein LOC131939618 [Physella acuta]|uniref:uncharacterized protein LOC131939618 n=1 Tax=Physella acuta TaxID=109671 RepID=UPI0027DB4A97|nr:uncharacterized protein LOC131939618 [Physella acuta]XP_059154017.1 uncharacterized protein LOC131939618 [Physella acuta]XP_059154018.1 uncharacterized protein LOC131939618 [Physella acuta]